MDDTPHRSGLPRALLVLVLTIGLLVPSLSSCGAWPTEQRTTALEIVARMESDGTLSPAQAAATREAIEAAADGFSLGDLAALIGQIAAGGLLAFLGIQRARGPSKPMSPIEAEAVRRMAQAEIARATAGKA